MTFSLMLLGVMLILVTFNVGESVYAKLRLKKGILILLIIATIVLYFIPNISVFGVIFTWVGFFLPAIYSILVLIKTRKLKDFFKMFVTALIAFVLNIGYNLITFEVYEANIFQPYLILGVILGGLSLFITNKPTKLYASNFIGLTLSEIAFYYTKYSVYQEFPLFVGNEKIFAVLLVSFVSSLMVYYIVRQVRKNFVKSRRKKEQKQKNYI